jgi:1-acyl-sn-glycerol-3-phosphate acyltransferase
MKTLGIALFSIYFWVASFAWMAFLSVATFFGSIFFGYQRVHLWISGPGFYWCLRLCLIRIKLVYDPGFDPWRPSVFCQNHVNLLDAHIACAAIPHAFCGLMHAWQFNIPFYGWLMGLSKGIRVYPGKQNMERMVVQARQRRSIGMSILTFPEGGRTLDGKVQPFRKGVFYMARDAGYPVVPICVKGNFEINRKGSRLFHPGRTLEIYVGPQFETAGLDDDGIKRLAKSLETYVAQRI